MSKKMQTIETFPVLYGIEKNGKEKMWSAHVETNKDKSSRNSSY